MGIKGVAGGSISFEDVTSIPMKMATRPMSSGINLSIRSGEVIVHLKEEQDQEE